MSPIGVDLDLDRKVIEELDFPIVCELVHRHTTCPVVASYLRVYCERSLYVCTIAHEQFLSSKPKEKCASCLRPVMDCWREYPLDGV